MKILIYGDLDSKDGLVPILDHAFNWIFNQKQSDDFIRIDPRLKNGPVSFCAVENGKTIGHVGVMDLTTRTLNGNIEYVGGLYGVATLPGHTRKGVCTALMEKAHEYFTEKHYRFSFLSTSPALIAHSFYENLGYVDLVEYPSAYKAFHNKKPKRSKKEKATGFNPQKILRIYNEFTKERTGFVVRDKAHLNMLRKNEGIKSKQCITDRDGYVVFREDKTGTWIRELVALNQEQMYTLLETIEERTRGPVYDRAVLDTKLLRVYESRGYMILQRGYSVMMFKPLAAGASFKQTYGDRFYLSRLDTF
jgi:predicted N-acetyltransferase YhbS